MNQSRKRQEGMITVEGVLSLVPFIIVILGIASFINLFALHNKIQFALYQMGGELTCYTYFYQALGIRAADLKLKNDIDQNTEKLDEAIEELDSFLSQIGSFEVQQTAGQGQQLVQTAGNLASDPKALLRGFVYLGLEKVEEKAKNLLLKTMSEGMIQAYLDEGFAEYFPRTADQYLKDYGVRDGINGLDFGKSRLFCDADYRMIDLVVEYDVEISLFKLFLRDPAVHVVQRCSVPAWLDGDGVTLPEK
ncbi:MAG: hypothetical protein OSJ69_15020 [Acetatifactor sp.]|nr:hypothetical protein [Acetatifactor sp.]